MQQREAMSGPTMAPPWLCGHDTNGEKFLYVLGLAADALLEKMSEGMLAKCPGQGDQSCIPLQAADRLLVQGPAEPNASFVARLKDAFNAWGKAGSRPAVLGQIQAYLTDLQPGVAADFPEALIVGGNTSLATWDVIYGSTPQGGAPAHSLVTPANWAWDTSGRVKRAWLVLFMNLVFTGQNGSTASVTSAASGFATITGLAGMVAGNVQQYLTVTGAASSGNNGAFQITSVVSATSVIIANPNAVAPDADNGAISWQVGAYPYIAPAPVWGSPSAVWGAGTWGVSCSELVIQSIRAILARWKSAGTYYPNIIVSFGGGDGTAGHEFSPLSSLGVGNPDNTWGDIGKLVAGGWVPAKQSIYSNKFTAFCDGTGRSIQCYEKNVT